MQIIIVDKQERKRKYFEVTISQIEVTALYCIKCIYIFFNCWYIYMNGGNFVSQQPASPYTEKFWANQTNLHRQNETIYLAP